MVRVRLFSLEDFPGTQSGGFANPDLTESIFDPSRRQIFVVRPPIGLDRPNVVMEY